ncbi:autotransporter outer membrane beta-barrel domain-containing protein [Pseudomonas sp. N40(2020)]|uniref:autotransporter outer membrane beta-barrel domain-containing protein n=1 Tax=Pseudomonas sp. N40(2020) TaxID=2767798 RepID=UPI0016571BAC|nr:autotransporter outer membrane beta-barrel domain-containing protein [Pseudomonas sp. N40(2020)]MBC8999251.1 autotransporter outer membrane beta-barrel domain-containing protein [Pseudomonas sp. N40(2020)]
MNSIYRAIWNRTRTYFMLPSESASDVLKSRNSLVRLSSKAPAFPLSTLSASLLLAFSSMGHAAAVLVDGTIYNGTGTMTTSGDNNPVLRVMNVGEATWSNGILSASGTGLGAVLVETNSTLNLIGMTVNSLMANTSGLMASGGSTVNLQNTQVATLGNSVALDVKEASQLLGNHVQINSTGSGLLVTNSTADVSNLDIVTHGSNGYGIATTGTSNVNVRGGSIETTNSRGYGIYATAGGTVVADDIAISTSGDNSRGVLASGEGAHISLDGGSITTSGGYAYGAQASQGATVDVKNMDITSNAEAVFADVGGTVNVESSNLHSTATAISAKQGGVVNANNVKITSDGSGPMLRASVGSNLNLTNSEVDLGEHGFWSSKIDGGIATLDNVRIHGERGGIGLYSASGGTVIGKNVDIALNGNGSYGVYVGTDDSSSVSLEDSRVVVNGTTAVGIVALTSGQHSVHLKNSLVSSNDYAIKGGVLAGVDVTADGSTIEGNILMGSRSVETSGEKIERMTLTATNGSRLKGDVSIDHDQTLDSGITLESGTTWQGAAQWLDKLGVNSGSAWTMTGDSSLGALSLNDGRVNFDHSNGLFKTLTVGNLSGNGSFLLNTDLATLQGDLLKVEGQVDGEHTLIVADSGHQAQGGALMLVDTNGGAGKFDLYGGKVDVGAFRYGLEQRGDDWYLAGTAQDAGGGEEPVGDTGGGAGGIVAPIDPIISNPQPENLSKGANAAIAQQAAATGLIGAQMNALTKRLGELRMGNDEGGLWTRGFGKEQRINTGSSRAFEQQVNGFEIGADKAIPFYNGKLYLGGMAGQGEARQNFGEGSKGQIDSAMLGTYATYIDQNGVYVDSVLKYTHLDNKVDITSNMGQKVDGKYKNHAVAASVEVGKQIDLGQGWFVEPQLELQAFRVGSGDYTASNGLKVEQDAVTSVQSRVGSLFGRNMKLDNGMTVQPYAKASWITEHAGDSHVSVNDVSLDSKLPGSRAEIGGGVILQTAEKHKFFIDAEYTKGDGIEQPYSVNVGYRYAW